MANIPTPDSIDSTKTKLQTAARRVGAYTTPTAVDIPEAPQTNSFNQLSAALSSIQPSLRQAITYVETEQTEADKAAAIIQSEKDHAETVKGINARNIPDGARPTYLHAYQVNRSKLNAERGVQLERESYYSPENAELRASDDPNAMADFHAKFKEGYDKAVGLDTYSDLERAKSKYGETLAAGFQSLNLAHLSYRVGEREKLGEQTVGNLMVTRIESMTSGKQPHEWDKASIGKMLTDVGYNQTTGQVTYGGMDGSKFSKTMTDSIVATAVSQGDASILEIAEHIQTSPGSYLAGTKYHREKSAAARDHIATSRWHEDERERIKSERRGAGIESNAEAEARSAETRARHEAEYVQREKQLKAQGRALDRSELVDLEATAIMKLHSVDGDMHSTEVVGHMKNLARIDPQAYQHMETFLQRSRSKQEGDASDRMYTNLRADLSNDPAKFDKSRIVAASNAGQLTSGQVSSLFDDAERSQKAAKEYPVLHSALINGLRSDLKGAIGTNPLSEFGEGRLQQNKGAAELNGLAVSFMQSHPEASEWELHQALEPHIERISRKYNKDLDKELTDAKTDEETKLQVAKAERQQREIQWADQQEAAGKKPLTTAEKRLALKNKGAK
jgi:hypothetical protein